MPPCSPTGCSRTGPLAPSSRASEKIVRFGRQIGARKVSSAAGNLFRDLTLSMFLRMGGKATAEQYGYQYGYRVPEQPADEPGERT